MKNLIRLTQYSEKEIIDIFQIVEKIKSGDYTEFLKGKTIVMFFPESSIRTRVTFEKGIYLLGGQPILFSPETLNKKETLEDVCGYLNNWADAVIIRHKNIKVLETMAQYMKVPVINAMTDINHPCEMIADMYALSKIREDFRKDNYLFCGIDGNIGRAWKEASDVMGFNLEQCCPEGNEIEGIKSYNAIDTAIIGKDIVCTDSLPSDIVAEFKNCKVTKDLMNRANKGAVINPCPPFFRGEELSKDVIESEYFVGYKFKQHLLEIQQAIIIYCLN